MPRTIIAHGVFLSALAGLGGFSLFLPVIVLPPCGKEAFIPRLGFEISGGSVRIHLLEEQDIERMGVEIAARCEEE